MAEVFVLEVRLHGRPIGTLTRLPGDRTLFAFSETYIEDPRRPTTTAATGRCGSRWPACS